MCGTRGEDACRFVPAVVGGGGLVMCSLEAGWSMCFFFFLKKKKSQDYGTFSDAVVVDFAVVVVTIVVTIVAAVTVVFVVAVIDDDVVDVVCCCYCYCYCCLLLLLLLWFVVVTVVCYCCYCVGVLCCLFLLLLLLLLLQLHIITAGKHVFCEKPLASTADGVRECYSLARKKGKVLLCAFNRRFDPSHQDVYERVRSGQVGRVQAARAVSRDSPTNPWSYLRTSGPGGIFFDSACHDIDLMTHFLGELPIKASKFTQNFA